MTAPTRRMLPDEQERERLQDLAAKYRNMHPEHQELILDQVIGSEEFQNDVELDPTDCVEAWLPPIVNEDIHIYKVVRFATMVDGENIMTDEKFFNYQTAQDRADHLCRTTPFVWWVRG